MDAEFRSEKRINPRISVSGDISFMAHWQSPRFGGDFAASTYVHAAVINTSAEGMCIKTTFPLTKQDLLERVMERPANISESAAVKWVEKKGGYYYAGILYPTETPKPKTESQ